MGQAGMLYMEPRIPLHWCRYFKAALHSSKAFSSLGSSPSSSAISTKIKCQSMTTKCSNLLIAQFLISYFLTFNGNNTINVFPGLHIIGHTRGASFIFELCFMKIFWIFIDLFKIKRKKSNIRPLQLLGLTQIFNHNKVIRIRKTNTNLFIKISFLTLYLS